MPESILALIGNTPLVRVRSFDTGPCELYLKLECQNPGGSIKDRIGLSMIEDAERRGLLRPGSTIVEATAGNTGLALAMVGRRLGYRVVLTVPEQFSVEKQRLMRALGGEVVLTPSEDGIPGAQRKARELAESTPGAVYVNQFSNVANPGAHAATTGPEIYDQMGGDIDALVAGCGSGGTFSGVARFLKTEIPNLLAVAVEPKGSILGGGEPGTYEVEGIGMSSLHPTMDLDVADEIISVPDDRAFQYVRRLAAECGVLAGSSAGAAVWAAVQVAQRLGAGTRVVTLIPDSSERYLSKDIYEKFPENP